MAASEVDEWLRSRYNVNCTRDWLDACLSWVARNNVERGPNVSAVDSVYAQWLHADIRDTVTSAGGLPSCVFQNEAGELNGSFVLQVDSIVDVGAPAYAQMQQTVGTEIDECDSSSTRPHGFDSKPSRMLLITLNDGCSSIQGMEYRPINQLSVKTPPGTKVLLNGTVQYRRGMLLLEDCHVTVLGGKVDELVAQNSQKNVLLRLLNLSSEDTDRVNNRPSEERFNRLNEEQFNNVRTEHIVVNQQQMTDPPSTNQMHNEGAGLYTSFGTKDGCGQDLDITDSDWDKFCDFDDNAGTKEANNIVRPSESQTPNEPAGSSTIVRPSDIILLPVGRVFSAIAGKPGHPVYTQASVCKIEGEIAKGATSWSIGAVITDTVNELPVTIGNKIIEILTGFTLAQFKSRSIPTVQMRQGLLRCHRTLASIDCVMELQWMSGEVTVTRLLDV